MRLGLLDDGISDALVWAGPKIGTSRPDHQIHFLRQLRAHVAALREPGGADDV